MVNFGPQNKKENNIDIVLSVVCDTKELGKLKRTYVAFLNVCTHSKEAEFHI